MSGWSAFLPIVGRIALLAAILAGLAAALTGALARRRRRIGVRAIRPASPHRPGHEKLAALLERSVDRPYSRDQALERLRALARDALALGRGIDDTAARAAIEAREGTIESGLAAFLAEDQMSSRGRSERFMEDFAAALDAVERLSTGIYGGSDDGDHGRYG